MTTSVQQLVDEALEAARSAHPGVEFDVTLSDVNALLLAKEADKLFREVSGRTGYYSGHVYRDCLVTGIPSLEATMIDHLVVIAPVIGTSTLADQAEIFYGISARAPSARNCRHVDPSAACRIHWREEER